MAAWPRVECNALQQEIYGVTSNCFGKYERHTLYGSFQEFEGAILNSGGEWKGYTKYQIQLQFKNETFNVGDATHMLGWEKEFVQDINQYFNTDRPSLIYQ